MKQTNPFFLELLFDNVSSRQQKLQYNSKRNNLFQEYCAPRHFRSWVQYKDNWLRSFDFPTLRSDAFLFGSDLPVFFLLSWLLLLYVLYIKWMCMCHGSCMWNREQPLRVGSFLSPLVPEITQVIRFDGRHLNHCATLLLALSKN